MKKVLVSIMSGCCIALVSCGSVSDYSPAASYGRSEFAPKVASVQSFRKEATLVKTGKMRMDVMDVEKASDGVDGVVKRNKGYVTSLDKRDDSMEYASYSIRVPYRNLVSTMDGVAALGTVKYRNIKIDDVTAERIKYEAKLKELYQRRARYQAMLRQATSVKDKMEVEKALAELENDIFSMELAAKEQAKHASFSKLSVALNRKSINGPLGATWKGMKWGLGKLFVIRD